METLGGRIFMCNVVLSFMGDGWGCRIICPDTSGNGVSGKSTPEAAFGACRDRWIEKMKAVHPHYAELGITL